ncbi:MarR family winged helix-turn-helix transcriptional regulator [Pseudoclavibacter caeni]|jgi:DNA-binding MarR family transcriptional regulator|uniref:MarR family winged helix-turn-helix transcriptional regulator n=1 Tax=Pseudoclavibacter caeni TaxID=908846 RepID=UPI0015CD0F1B|nr:MarR family winged helix-turn-helix transcriptional regulator [Pseudoclavibacter caeni]NYJ97370.1 DNA-binding MarR family transcriptional regulator [Pseudoclavibacter caeni]
MTKAASRARTRLANEAWEALFRAQGVLLREFAAADLWHPATLSEYDVLYTLARHPDGLDQRTLGQDVMLTQPGLSRLVERLVTRGWVSRGRDLRDARRVRLGLTEAGHEVQRTIGRRHARQVADRMTASLDDAQLTGLRDLARRLIDRADGTSRGRAPAGQTAAGRSDSGRPSENRADSGPDGMEDAAASAVASETSGS